MDLCIPGDWRQLPLVLCVLATWFGDLPEASFSIIKAALGGQVLTVSVCFGHIPKLSLPFRFKSSRLHSWYLSSKPGNWESRLSIRTSINERFSTIIIILDFQRMYGHGSKHGGLKPDFPIYLAMNWGWISIFRHASKYQKWSNLHQFTSSIPIISPSYPHHIPI